jgi:hypothetical protein
MKVAAGVAVLAVGGTAVAAETGSLPPAAQHHAHGWLSALGVPPPDPRPLPPGAPSATADPATVDPTRSPAPGRAVPAPSPKSPVPATPKARGLCHAWQAANVKKNGKPMKAESGRMLAAMAGGASNIPGFCAPYLPKSSPAPAPTPSVTTGPTHPGNGNGNGNGGENGNGNGNGGPKGSGSGKSGGNDTRTAVVNGRAGPPE